MVEGNRKCKDREERHYNEKGEKGEEIIGEKTTTPCKTISENFEEEKKIV